MEEATRSNFIWDAIEQDLKEGRYQQVHTRFPPEPNGYMHIGHCKALIMDFLTAEKFGGKCNLRFDDTNPAKEDTEYVEAIKRDIEWLGFHWTGGLYYASDYYDKCYEIAEDWIKRGLAYVDQLNKDEIHKIVGLMIKQLNKRTMELGKVSLELDDAAIDWIVAKGYQPKYGARPLRREIQSAIEDPLSDLILGDKITPGSRMLITVKDGKLHFGKKRGKIR